MHLVDHCMLLQLLLEMECLTKTLSPRWVSLKQDFFDQWHLMDSGLRKKFGDHGHNLLKSNLLTSKSEFETVLSAAKELINSQVMVDGNIFSTLNQFAEYCQLHTFYSLEKVQTIMDCWVLLLLSKIMPAF